MPIQLIDNFELSVPKPIDNRIVVGTGFTYTNRNSIPLPYKGMRIYDTTNNIPYVYNGATWSFDNDKVAITDDLLSASLNYIPFVSGTSSVQSLKSSSTRLRFLPSTGRLQFAEGSVSAPTLSFLGTSTNTGPPFNITFQNYIGIYRPNTSTLAMSINGFNRLEVGALGITASVRFFVKSDSLLTDSRGQGGVSFANTVGSTSFDFFTFNTLTSLRLYPISAGSPQTEQLRIDNYTGYSEFILRDEQYFNLKTSNGILQLGNSGANGQFTFYMNGNNTFTSGGSFDYDGGGLIIQKNLSVSGATRLGSTVSVLGDAYLNDRTLFLRAYPYIDDEINVGETVNDESFLKYATSFAGYSINGAVLSGLSGGALGTGRQYGGILDVEENVALHWSVTGNIGIGTASISNTRLRIASSNLLSTSNTLRVISKTGLDYFVVRNDGYSSLGTSVATGTRLNIMGDSTSTNFGLRVLDSSSVVNLAVRNDGHIRIGSGNSWRFSNKRSGSINGTSFPSPTTTVPVIFPFISGLTSCVMRVEATFTSIFHNSINPPTFIVSKTSKLLKVIEYDSSGVPTTIGSSVIYDVDDSASLISSNSIDPGVGGYAQLTIVFSNPGLITAYWDTQFEAEYTVTYFNDALN